MDDRTNTIAGWALAGGIVALGLGIVTGEYFHAERPEKMGYVVEGVVEEGEGGGGEAEQPIAFYLASADPARGEQVFKKCAACHNADKGGANGLGPNLYGTLGKPIGQGAGGFAFSDALKGKGGSWTWDTMSEWLKSPKAFAPGTKMTFAGLSKPEERADVIAFLNAHSDAPQTPPPPPAAAAAVAAGTEAGAKPGENTLGEGAKTQPVITEGQAAASPEGTVGGGAATATSGTAEQERK